jgi:hypothetical protein
MAVPELQTRNICTWNRGLQLRAVLNRGAPHHFFRRCPWREDIEDKLEIPPPIVFTRAPQGLREASRLGDGEIHRQRY